jgi:hypothetical protein
MVFGRHTLRRLVCAPVLTVVGIVGVLSVGRSRFSRLIPNRREYDRIRFARLDVV